MRRGEDDRLHRSIVERVLQDAAGGNVHLAHEADALALAVHGLEQRAPPAAEADDRGADHGARSASMMAAGSASAPAIAIAADNSATLVRMSGNTWRCRSASSRISRASLRVCASLDCGA